ncbi:MAG: hypothetical protein BMS9Abin07_1777 [Acidimicrobiia bacterium]|nr:MAG: hypothetical protein BMS9Abin07_1777 [Acidimicrobiia bacterium]
MVGSMPRLSAFAAHRFIGTRDEMRLFDCDDADEFDRLEQRVASDDLVASKGLQSFSPDIVAEARNRGFRRS